jgi:hypothetical protein
MSYSMYSYDRVHFLYLNRVSYNKVVVATEIRVELFILAHYTKQSLFSLIHVVTFLHSCQH